MRALHVIILALVALSAAVSAHNVTKMLEPFPEYSKFNEYLTETRLADDINSRNTLTVLVLTNSEMEDIAGKHPLSVIKRLLSLLVVLDYFDAPKLHKLPDGSELVTTLFQTTGNAPASNGFVNITELKGGKIGFGSAAPGSELDSTYTKSVKQLPYNISIMEISKPIVAPGILTAPAPTAGDVNIIAVLEKAGCKTFAGLLSSSGVVKTFQTASAKGLTIFAPNDEAFKAEDVPDLNQLSSADLVSLLLFHGKGSYSSKGTLKTTTAPFSTLATGGAGKYEISVTTAGDDVTLRTGVGSSRVADTVLDDPPLMIMSVDSVLLPEELYGKAPSPAPASEPVAAPTPGPALSPASAPSPFAVSPPAPPPSDTQDESPAGSPSAESENSTSPNGAGELPRGHALVAMVATLVVAAAFLS